MEMFFVMQEEWACMPDAIREIRKRNINAQIRYLVELNEDALLPRIRALQTELGDLLMDSHSHGVLDPIVYGNRQKYLSDRELRIRYLQGFIGEKEFLQRAYDNRIIKVS